MASKRWLPLCVLLLAFALSIGRGTARAHGTLDQKLDNDPACLTSTLRATAASSSTLRQEFVPANSGLQSVDVCITVPSGAPLIVLNVRSGNAASPGPVLATVSNPGVASGTRYVHFELSSLLPTTAGTMYVLEISGMPLFYWRGSCGSVVLPDCPTADTMIDYTPGVSNAPAPVGDLAFRTYSSIDTDGDHLADPVDNCPFDANAGQENNDREFIDLPSNWAFDDLTNPKNDYPGDACDTDDDNDGLTDTVETSGPPCASATGATNPLVDDTDGDTFTDGAECALGSDPALFSSKPTAPAPANDSDHDGLSNALEATLGTDPNLVDTDGDRINDGVEYLHYNTNPRDQDTDLDACSDGHEIASVNADRKVNSTDMLVVSKSFGMQGSSPNYFIDFDMNKDAKINSTDMLIVAQQFSTCITPP